MASGGGLARGLLPKSSASEAAIKRAECEEIEFVVEGHFDASSGDEQQSGQPAAIGSVDVLLSADVRIASDSWKYRGGG
jgi:hypothetical protein